MIGWPSVSLSEIANVFNGKTPSKPDQRNEGFPVLKIRDVDETGRFRGQGGSFVEPAFANRYRSKWIQPNDILILNAAHNADYVASKTFFAGKSVAGFLPTGEWLIIRANSARIIPGFVDFWLKTEKIRQAIRFLVNGIHLYPKDIANLSIEIPPLDEQRRIVGLLDRAVEIRRRAEAARAKARAIIPALFLDTFGDPATNPKGWPIVTVGDLSIGGLRNGISPSKSGVVSGTVLTLSAITRGIFDTSASKESMFTTPLREDQAVIGSLFLICRGNGNPKLVGQGAFPSWDMPGVAFPDTMIAFRPDKSRIEGRYLSAVWRSDHIRTQVKAAAKTTNGTYKINQTSLEQFSIPLPPLDIQAAFAERVRHIEGLARGLDATANKAEAMAAALSAEVFG